jgi:hypothetical protein
MITNRAIWFLLRLMIQMGLSKKMGSPLFSRVIFGLEAASRKRRCFGNL